MFEYVSQYTKQAFPFYSHFVCGSRRISALMEIPPPSHTHTHWRKAEVCRMCIARKNLEAHTKYNQVRTRAEKCHTPVQAGLVMQGIDTSPAAYQTALANKSSPIRVCLPGLLWPGLAGLPFSQFAIAFALIFHAATVVAPSVVA